MIPKTIHYCWFGNNSKNETMLRSIASWKKQCPDFVIQEWNETNFPIENHPFTKKMYSKKKWAFVSDYARLVILEERGGFYLDTDMLLVKPLPELQNISCILGEEKEGIISAGMIASTPHHLFIQTCKAFYDDNPKKLITIPRVLTYIFNAYPSKTSIHVYPSKTFYPFDDQHIQEYRGQDLGNEVIGVHLWNYSWGHPLNKFFKKMGIYSFGKKITEILGIKKILKKMFGFV